eukprot:5453270-Ditylum_brightwellii.AAC.1
MSGNSRSEEEGHNSGNATVNTTLTGLTIHEHGDKVSDLIDKVATRTKVLNIQNSMEVEDNMTQISGSL